MASLAAIVMLISICRFGRRKTKATRFAYRRLSKEKAGPSGRPEICRETQEEAETSLSEEGLPASALLGGVQSFTKKRKQREGEDEGAESVAGPSGVYSPPQEKRKATQEHLELPQRVMQPVPQQPGEEYDEGEQFVPPVPFAQQQQSITSKADPVFLPPLSMITAALGERTREEAVAVQAMLMLQHKAFILGRPSEETPQQEKEEPQRSTSTQTTSPSVHILPEEPRVMGAAGATAGLEELSFVPQVCQPNHAYVRLPKLQPGVIPMRLDLRRAFTSGHTSARPLTTMRIVRELLLKESLNQTDANMLVCLLETLVAHCDQHQRMAPNPKDIRRMADVFGTRFILLEMIIAGIQVTQQDFNLSEWRYFVSTIPHDMSGCPQGRIGGVPRKSLYGGLARALSRALEILKKGQRPDNNVLYGLKYALFCISSIPTRFHSSIYDVWKEDCHDGR